MSHHKIVFSGTILPGFDTTEVKARLESMLKIPPGKAGMLYSGREIVLKSGLDASQADLYRRKLIAMGIGASVRNDAPSVASPKMTAQPDEAPAAPLAAQKHGLSLVSDDRDQSAATTGQPDDDKPSRETVPEMACPECGHLQPKRNLCLKCGVNMSQILTARQQAAEESQHAADASIKIHDDTSDHDIEVERPRYLSTNLDGRLGRRSYFMGSLMVALAVFLVSVLIALTGAFKPETLSIPMVVIGSLLSLRISALRFHDFNWSGWWALLCLIPGVNIVVWLLLQFMPGTQGTNSFGPRSSPTPWLPVIIIAGAIVILSVLLFSTALKSYSSYVERSRGHSSAAPAYYNSARNEVLVFSMTQCPKCDVTRAQLDQAGIEFSERVVDRDEAARDELVQSLRDIEHTGQVQLPVVVVNDYVLVNDPPMSEILQYLEQ